MDELTYFIFDCGLLRGFSNMSAAAVLVVGIIFCFLARLLYFTSVPVKPTVFCGDQKFLENVLKYCSCLNEIYRPPGLWGRSGHLQTIIHGLFGRVKVPYVKGERWTATMSDGATATFDIYESHTKDPEKEDCILLICPGIANSSESVYIQTFVMYALKNGYYCAVQNHLGSVQDVKVTSPRLFTYGATDEFHQMTIQMARRYPTYKMIPVGFSMGGNIITKYLGEKRERPVTLIAGVAICQGYDALRAQPMLSRWENLRRFYVLIITETVKDLMRRYRDKLLCELAVKRYKLEERKIFQAQTIMELDEYYTRRVAGFSSLGEFYINQSSANYMNGIEVPMLFVNAEDDPLVPISLLDIPKAFVENENNRSVLVVTKHGGHLAFFEGGIILPSRVTWIERLVIQYVNSIASVAS